MAAVAQAYDSECVDFEYNPHDSTEGTVGMRVFLGIPNPLVGASAAKVMTINEISLTPPVFDCRPKPDGQLDIYVTMKIAREHVEVAEQLGKSLNLNELDEMRSSSGLPPRQRSAIPFTITLNGLSNDPRGDVITVSPPSDEDGDGDGGFSHSQTSSAVSSRFNSKANNSVAHRVSDRSWPPLQHAAQAVAAPSAPPQLPPSPPRICVAPQRPQPPLKFTIKIMEQSKGTVYGSVHVDPSLDLNHLFAHIVNLSNRNVAQGSFLHNSGRLLEVSPSNPSNAHSTISKIGLRDGSEFYVVFLQK